MSETEKALDMLFGVATDAKKELTKLKDVTEYEMLPEVMKDTILDTSKSMEDVEIEHVTNTSPEVIGVADDGNEETISTHNSARALGDEPITNNSNRVVEEEIGIALNNAEEVHEHEVIDGNISTNNFVDEQL